jgi:hypothetical protein
MKKTLLLVALGISLVPLAVAATAGVTSQEPAAAPAASAPTGCLIVKHKGTIGRRLIFTALILMPIAPGAKYEMVDGIGYKGAKVAFTARELEMVQATGMHVIILQNKYQQDELAGARQACQTATPDPAKLAPMK